MEANLHAEIGTYRIERCETRISDLKVDVREKGKTDKSPAKRMSTGLKSTAKSRTYQSRMEQTLPRLKKKKRLIYEPLKRRVKHEA